MNFWKTSRAYFGHWYRNVKSYRRLHTELQAPTEGGESSFTKKMLCDEEDFKFVIEYLTQTKKISYTPRSKEMFIQYI